VKFGKFELKGAKGVLLAHSQKVKSGVIKKGTRLNTNHLSQLSAAGFDTIVGARLEPGDISEDNAASALATALGGTGLIVANAKTGRANLHAAADGIAIIDHDRIHRINMLDERITVATLRPYTAIVPRQLIATVKIISYAVPEFILERTIEVATRSGPAISVASFKSKRAALLMTRTGEKDDKLLAKGKRVTAERLARFGQGLETARTVTHEEGEVASALKDLTAQGHELIMVLSASAIVDRADVVPKALEDAGGRIVQFGMPVDPGNLLLLGTMGKAHVVGIPGCARSPSLNGFDWVLERLHADLKVGTRDISRMGVGGLLKEIPSRPEPRDQIAPSQKTSAALKVQILILAAGQSRRMGPKNKLLEDLAGKPVIAHVADAAQASRASGITVVTGYEHDKIEDALKARGHTFVNNPGYALGLSSSLKTGIANLPEHIDGALICLGDMPFVTSDEIDQVIDAFRAAGPGTICLPTVHGKSGNPVLLPRSLFSELLDLEGDVGAKGVVEQHPDAIVRVDLNSQSALVDIDTEEMLEEAKNHPAPSE
jgi:molybdenum cofactor cytidylyltransferase